MDRLEHHECRPGTLGFGLIDTDGRTNHSILTEIQELDGYYGRAEMLLRPGMIFDWWTGGAMLVLRPGDTLFGVLVG